MQTWFFISFFYLLMDTWPKSTSDWKTIVRCQITIEAHPKSNHLMLSIYFNLRSGNINGWILGSLKINQRNLLRKPILEQKWCSIWLGELMNIWKWNLKNHYFNLTEAIQELIFQTIFIWQRAFSQICKTLTSVYLRKEKV